MITFNDRFDNKPFPFDDVHHLFSGNPIGNYGEYFIRSAGIEHARVAGIFKTKVHSLYHFNGMFPAMMDEYFFA